MLTAGGFALGVSEQRQRFKSLADDRLGRKAEPVREQRRVDSSEIGVKFQVTVVEHVDAGVIANQSRPGDWTHHEDRRGRAMIGSI